jgi:hypothetical protein
MILEKRMGRSLDHEIPSDGPRIIIAIQTPETTFQNPVTGFQNLAAASQEPLTDISKGQTNGKEECITFYYNKNEKLR